MILIYGVSVILIVIAGYNYKSTLAIKHSQHALWLAKGIVRVTKYIPCQSKFSSDLYTMYGKKGIQEMKQWHISLKIASSIIFLFLPLLLLVLQQENKTVEFYFLLGMALLGYYLPDLDLRHKSSQRKSENIIDFSRFTYRLTLYLHSGVTVYQAFKKSIDQKSDSYFMSHMHKVILKSEAGHVFVDELINFAHEINMSEVNSLITIITQNLQNGGKIEKRVSEYSKEIWENRKNRALTRGEKAGVKMVFPLMLGLLGVVMIVVTPAILLLQQI